MDLDLDMFIIAVWRMDDALKTLFQEKPLRQRGPAPGCPTLRF